MWFQGIASAGSQLWLRQGLKYAFSEHLFGPAWNIQVNDALKRYNLTLDGCKTLQDAMKVFRGHAVWQPDPLWQACDVVFPPALLLARGGDDCDGWAMIHAQAADYVLHAQMWRSVIVSYFSDPWSMSHHFAVAIDPIGQHWVMQPGPTSTQPADANVISGPYTSIDECVKTVSGWYNVTAIWWDVRTPMWQPVKL